MDQDLSLTPLFLNAREHHFGFDQREPQLYTVRLGKMAQHARLWALFMAKLKGQSQNASNLALGELIGLQHIQKLASYVKNCGL